jgi:histidinol-phosphate aminotransferase
MRLRPEIARLPAYRPGVEYADLVREAGGRPLVRLDNNEAPWPPFPEALEAIRRAASDLHRYPDISCGELLAALAAFHEVPRDRIVVGSGSVSLIRMLALILLSPGDEVVVATPPYPAYGMAARLMGATVRGVAARDGEPDVEAMAAAVGPRTKIVFVATPHNPTGGIVRRRALEAYLDRVPDHVVTVLDQAYQEYVMDPDGPDGRRYLDAGKPLITLRTFSKVYGLAGLRIGYGFATDALREALDRARENFPITSLGQAAAIASLARPDLVRERARATAAERTRMSALCHALGVACASSQGNFVFLDVRRDADAVAAALRRRGVLVRSGRVHGTPTCIRVTVGTPEDTARFAEALGQTLSEVGEASG